MKHMEHMVFPVLKFNNAGSEISFGGTPAAIRKTNLYSLRTGQYHQAFFIDASGKKYEVIKVRILRLARPFFHLLLFDPVFQVDFDLSEPEQLHIDKIREITTTALRREGIWNKNIYSGVQKSGSVEEVIDVLLEGFYGKHGLDIPPEE